MSKQYRLYLHANGYFYHRVKVPADIRSLYGKEIQQTSLKTRDFRHAVRRLPAVIVEVDRIFFELRAQNAKGLGTQRGVGGQFPTPVILVKTEHRNHTDDAVDLLEDIRRVVRAEISSFQGEHAANLHEQLSEQSLDCRLTIL